MGSSHSHNYSNSGSNTFVQPIESKVLPIKSDILESLKNLNPNEIPQTTQKVEPMPSKNEQFRTCIRNCDPPNLTNKYLNKVKDCHFENGK